MEIIDTISGLDVVDPLLQNGNEVPCLAGARHKMR